MPPARARSTLAALALFLTLTFLPTPARAWWPHFSETGLGLYGHTDLDIKGGNLGGLGLGAHLAAPLHLSERLRLDLRLEMSGSGFWNYASGAEVAAASGLRLYLPPPKPQGLAPFMEAGLGLSFDELHIPELGTRFNFLSFCGLGLRQGIAPDTFLDLGYRIRHISNGGLDERNHGVTSHLIGLDLAWNF
jgi:hypothetical protein